MLNQLKKLRVKPIMHKQPIEPGLNNFTFSYKSMSYQDMEALPEPEPELEPEPEPEPLELEELSPQEQMLAHILERLDDTGDLPIFSASVNQVQLVGSDPDSDAMELAVELLKDANLTTKMLKLANSTYYSRGRGSISSLSRAVVVLGFDTVKSTVLTMKLIDSFNKTVAPTEDELNIDNMLVKAYMSAGFVKEVAEASGDKRAEQSYVCGLLHNLGEIIVAAVLPEKYQKMQALLVTHSWAKAQKQVLGMPLYAVGKAVLEKWNFPESMTATMLPHKPNKKGRIKNGPELNRSLASLTTSIMDLLYSEKPAGTKNFEELQAELVKATGLKSKTIKTCLTSAFTKSCDLAENYGLDVEFLVPNTSTSSSEDSLRDEIASELAGLITEDESQEEEDFQDTDDEYDGYDDAPQQVIEQDDNAPASQQNPKANMSVMLAISQQLNALIGQKAPLNTVFDKVLEGMIDGVGFDRAMLCLLSPDKKRYGSRIAAGKKSADIRQIFKDRILDTKHDLISQVIMEGNEVLVADVRSAQWQNKLPTEILENLDCDSFLVAAVQVHGKPVGIFYGDKVIQKTKIESTEFRGFMQLVSQAQLALQVR